MMTVDDTRYISLNTQHCIKKPSVGSGINQYESSFLSQVSFDFKDVLKDADDILYSHVDIVNAQIPVSFYLINYTNNTLSYKINNGVIQTMTIERGNYNITTLITAIKQGFLNAGYAFTITFNKITGKLTFVSPLLTTFTVLSSGSGGVNEIIGFDSVSSYTSVGNILVGEHPCSLIGIKKLKISSSALRTSGLSSGGGGDLLGIIPVNAPPNGLLLYENNSTKKGGLLRNKEISNIDITITDENNRYVNFNNTEYSLTIAITTTRILQENNNSSFRDSTQQIMNTSQPQPIETDDLDLYMYKLGIQI